MSNPVEHIAEKLFKIIKGFGHDLVIFTDSGKKTVDPQEARRFYATDIQMMINYSVSNSENEIIINLSKDTDIKKIKPMLNSIRTLANQYIIEYRVKTFGKTIKPKDFSFMAKQKTNENGEVIRASAPYRVTFELKNKAGTAWSKTGRSFETKQEAKEFISRKKGDERYRKMSGVLERGNQYETREMTRAALMKKINDGKWEATQDVKPGRHVEIRNTETNKKMNIMVKESFKVDIDWDGPQTARVVNYTNDMIELVSDQGEEMEIYLDDPDFRDVMNQIQSQIDHDDWREKQYLDRVNRQVDKFRSMRESQKIEEGFSGWHGTAKKSINELGDARLIVHHKRSVKEEREIPLSHRKKHDNVFYRVLHNGKDAIGKMQDYEEAKFRAREYRKQMRRGGYNDKDVTIHAYTDDPKMGARSRQIESIFIENNEGERFKFPSNNITAAKSMVRHVKEGGTPYDDFGQYIYETMEELNQLKVFQRKNRRNDFFEDANISEEIGNRVTQLRNNLNQISGIKGYAYHFENFTRENTEVGKEKLDELKDNVTVQFFDESISNSLPYIARIIENMRGRQAKEQEILDFAKYVMDNKDNIIVNSPVDSDDPENPGNRRFRDPATAFSAWVNYLAPKMKDDVLANKMMQVSDDVFQVGGQHLKMASAAIRVIAQNAQVAGGKKTQETQTGDYQEKINQINEAFDSLANMRHIF